MKVLDPDVKPSDRAEVQSTMLGPKVLDAERFPEIRFRSTRVTREGDAWRVEGELSLHGQTRPVTLRVSGSGGLYIGSLKLKQTAFGIQPVTAGGGTVKVKDELQLDFHIALK
jgi:polyisoprenoid-binding protein YceI